MFATTATASAPMQPTSHHPNARRDTNHRGWNAAVDFIYDYRQQVLLYTTTQLTYNTDCCGLSVQYRRYNVGIRDETLEYFSFSIANIGNFGNLKKQDRLF